MSLARHHRVRGIGAIFLTLVPDALTERSSQCCRPARATRCSDVEFALAVDWPAWQPPLCSPLICELWIGGSNRHQGRLTQIEEARGQATDRRLLSPANICAGRALSLTDRNSSEVRPPPAGSTDSVQFSLGRPI